MKSIIRGQDLKQSLLIGAIIAAACISAQAQNVVVTRFEDGNYITNGMWSWWGGATKTWEWDPTVDAGGGTNAGSLKITVNYSGTGDNQYAVGMSWSGLGAYNSGVVLNSVNFTNIEFDLLWDTNSTMPLYNVNSTGDPNGVGFGLATPGWGQTWPPNGVQPKAETNGAWQHVSIPVNPAWPNSPGFVFKKWFPASATNTGSYTFWIDNIVFKTNSNPNIPNPSLTIGNAKKGLNLMSSKPGGQYAREGIRSLPADSVQWYGNTNPVTYSVTFSDFPDGAAHGGFQSHIFLVPDTAGGTAPDYADPNAIMLEFQHWAGGQGACTFRWKTNQPNDNTQMYTAGQGLLAQVVAPTILGTWNITFSNNNNVTIVGPGASTNVNIPADAAALLASVSGPPSMGTYFGIQPNNAANYGQRAVISEIKVTDGTNVVVDDTFPLEDPVNVVDPNLWTLRCDDGANALRLVDSTPAYWVTWKLPDSSFAGLQTSDKINTNWALSDLTIKLNGEQKDVFVANSVLTNPAMYFRLLGTNSNPAPPPTLLESFEAGAFTGAANPPYTNVAQSSVAVTDGSYSMLINYDNSGTWSWMTKNYDGAMYAAWYSHTKLKFDVHRDAELFGWNLDLAFALNGAMGWTQAEPINWVWLNAGETSTETITFDYSAVKAGAPSTGTYFQLNLMARGNGTGGGNVYLDNFRLTD